MRRYFWWIIMADAISMSITYKLTYGRNILTEIPIFQMFGEWFGGRNNRQIEAPVRPQLQNEQQRPLLQPNQANQTNQLNQTNQQIKPNQPAKPNHPVKPNQQIIINQQSQQKISKDTKKPINDETDELDIDLLTENESHPDEKTQKIIEKSVNNSVIDGAEDAINKTDETNEVNETSEPNQVNETGETNKINEPVDTENISQTDSKDKDIGPKLTPENIDKYVINRNKIKIKLKTPDADIKSEDLNL
jgi:hypothetical protein